MLQSFRKRSDVQMFHGKLLQPPRVSSLRSGQPKLPFLTGTSVCISSSCVRAAESESAAPKAVGACFGLVLVGGALAYDSLRDNSEFKTVITTEDGEQWSNFPYLCREYIDFVIMSDEQQMVYNELKKDQRFEAKKIIKKLSKTMQSIEARRRELALSSPSCVDIATGLNKLSELESDARLTYQADMYKVLNKHKTELEYLETPAALNVLADSMWLDTGCDRRHQPRIFQVELDTTKSDNLNVVEIEHMVSKLKLYAKRGDVVVVRLTSLGGSAIEYGLAKNHLLRLKDAGLLLHVCVDHIAASGGMELAAIADYITVAPLAELGSIGVVYTPSKQTKETEEGIEAIIIQPDDMINSDEECQWKFVQRVYKYFKDVMTTSRPAITNIDEVATGECFRGKIAFAKGLADSVDTADEHVMQLKTMLGGDDVQVLNMTVTKRQPTLSDVCNAVFKNCVSVGIVMVGGYKQAVGDFVYQLDLQYRTTSQRVPTPTSLPQPQQVVVAKRPKFVLSHYIPQDFVRLYNVLCDAWRVLVRGGDEQHAAIAGAGLPRDCRL